MALTHQHHDHGPQAATAENTAESAFDLNGSAGDPVAAAAFEASLIPAARAHAPDNREAEWRAEATQQFAAQLADRQEARDRAAQVIAEKAKIKRAQLKARIKARQEAKAAEVAKAAAAARARTAATRAKKITAEVSRSSSRDPKSIAREMIAQRGWGSGQFSCLNLLWTRESGWNPNAENASSGAYGIAQALPGSKMASAGSDWRTNAATQIKWGLGYISDRYGTPCGAWSHSEATGWY